MKRELGALFPELEKDLKPYTAEATTGILPYQDICRLIDGGRISCAGGDRARAGAAGEPRPAPRRQGLARAREFPARHFAGGGEDRAAENA